MTSYSDSITAAIRDGEDLVAWAEPNITVFGDQRAEAVLLEALSGPVDDKMAMGVPLLRFANKDIEALPLVHGIVSNFAGTNRSHHCDRCNGQGVVNLAQLLVPMGGSAVVMNACITCRHILDGQFPGLIWNG